MLIRLLAIALLWTPSSWGKTDTISMISEITPLAKNPKKYLAKKDKLMLLGNTSLLEARIIFFPEVHDDPESLITQLLLLSNEKNRSAKTIFLGEGISALTKSGWELFSQKTLDIVAAAVNFGQYSPLRIEKYLFDLATNLSKMPGVLRFQSGLWTLSDFASTPTQFYGWDSKNTSALIVRNKEMVRSIKEALKKNDRVVVTMGARHVPELEYWSSLMMLCPGHGIKDMNSYFSRIIRRFGNEPNLARGIGSTTPIYNYLANQKYVVVFDKNMLTKIANTIKTNQYCFNLKY